MNMVVEAVNKRQSTTAPPFPGLRPFSKRDHEYFFGRETQKYALYLLLTRNHFISVVGSSGSGKSSIVRAGLLPMLDGENINSDGNLWQYTTMRPGRDPIERLARALTKLSMNESDPLFGARRDRLAAVLRASRDGISEALEQTAPGKAGQFVLVVDQFEELFRYLSAGAQANRIETAKRREEATNFVQLLLAATRSYDSRIRVVITMRSDFIGDCANFHGLPEVVSAAQFLVPSLSRDQREEAIRAPIERSGASIASELVERLLNDSNEELDQLPVLQHCLARLWMRASSSDVLVRPSGSADLPTALVRHLTEQDYKNIGGLAGALSGHADEILDSLPGKETTVERIFRALAEIDKDGRAIRRPRELGQLIAETATDRDEVCAVLDEFRADDCSFIVPPLSLAPTARLPDDTVIDVGHEALLRRWKRVSGDPEATGERADKRDIGWLRKEQKDGERYQFLRSCLDPETSNESRLSDDQVKRYYAWWASWKPNRVWAARYGGRFDEVDRLIKDSYVASLRSRWRKRATYAAATAAVALVGLAGLFLLEQHRLADRTFRFAIDSADRFSKGILDAYNDGEISMAVAQNLRTIADNIYPKARSRVEASEFEALRTRWLLTDSDLDDALNRKEDMRAQAEEAERQARRYLVRDPEDRRWLELLYGSLFRLGDIDLDEGRIEAATARYAESEAIARKLYIDQSSFTAAEELAERRFNLAFAINKVGEALLEQNEFAGALVKFREAFGLATANEASSRMEQRVQSAATRIKIAAAIIRNPTGNPAEALQNYTEAIQRYQTIFADAPTNNIVRSNLARAYQSRAAVYLKAGRFDEAFGDYGNASVIWEQMVQYNPLDIGLLSNLAKARAEFGTALELYARSRHESLDRAVEQFGREVAVREKLVKKNPTDPAWRAILHESRERLRHLQETATAKPNLPE